MNDDGVAAAAEFDRTSSTPIWPVYTGKSFNLWNPDTGRYYDSADAEGMISHLLWKRLNQHKSRRSAFAEQEEAIVTDPATLPCRHPRIAFRDVSRSTDSRTLIGALLPRNLVIVEKAPYLLRVQGTAADEAYVLGVLCSMVCDWQARRIIELKLAFAHLNALSIPDPGDGNLVRDRVAEIAGRLAAIDERFADWAAEVGVPVGSVKDEATKNDLIAELDAGAALLYGLDEDDLAVIYETFSQTVDYSDHCAAVLAHFRRMRAQL